MGSFGNALGNNVQRVVRFTSVSEQAGGANRTCHCQAGTSFIFSLAAAAKKIALGVNRGVNKSRFVPKVLG